MIPGNGKPEDDLTHADLERTRADDDQTSSDSDQSGSDSDQTGSDSDQLSADRDQRASDEDQATSDRALVHGLDRESYDLSKGARERSTQLRQEATKDRYHTALARDSIARKRDVAARARDRAAEAHDREADELDAELARLTSGSGPEQSPNPEWVLRRAAHDRQRAAADRARAAAHRAQAARDREQAAHDREEAAAERSADAVDELTGARRRGSGLHELQHEIDRARRGSGRLVVAYVDVDGLKLTNDTEGHAAGDALLKHVVKVLQAHLRSYELIMRLGGDEFVCAMSDATIENVERRFEEMAGELAAPPDGGSISVGFAELDPSDSPMDLIDRADRALLAARRQRRRPIAGPAQNRRRPAESPNPAPTR